jgi:hypothetical protein
LGQRERKSAGISVGKDWRNRNLPALLVGIQNGTVTLENRMVVPQKIIDLPDDSAIPLLN